MASKLTRLTHRIAIQLNLVAESCTICSSRSRPPVPKLLDIPSFTGWANFWPMRNITLFKCKRFKNFLWILQPADIGKWNSLLHAYTIWRSEPTYSVWGFLRDKIVLHLKLISVNTYIRTVRHTNRCNVLFSLSSYTLRIAIDGW
jgi:hypothetical protein